MNLEKCNELRFSPRCKRGLVGGKLPTNDQIQALGKELLKERFNDALNSIPNLIYEKNFD